MYEKPSSNCRYYRIDEGTADALLVDRTARDIHIDYDIQVRANTITSIAGGKTQYLIFWHNFVFYRFFKNATNTCSRADRWCERLAAAL